MIFFNYCSVSKGLTFKTKYLLNKYFRDFPQHIPTYDLTKFIMQPIPLKDPY